MATIVLRNVRLSYPDLFEPVPNQDGTKEEYGASLILDPDDPTTQELEDALYQAGVDKWGQKAFDKFLTQASFKRGLRNADDEGKDDPAYEGKMFINVHSTRKPQVVDRKMMPITDPDEVYAGCYVNVSVSPFAYDVDKSKGLSARLGNVQFVRDGERLGGGTTAEDDFTALDDDEDEEETVAPPRRRSLSAAKPAPAKQDWGGKKAKAKEEDVEEEQEEVDDDEPAPPVKPARRRLAR
jgi:hypothetical protein